MYRQPGKVLRGFCSGAQNLIIAAPYIKADALVKVLADVRPAASLICITRWQPNDLAVGASDVECRAIVTKRGGSFRQHPSLHAKYYQIDDVVLIGSANLTSSAMGWAPHSNLEILCHAGDDFDARSFQQELLKGSREISDDEFARWEAIVKINTRSSTTSGEQPMLGSWRPKTRELRNLERAYRDRGDEIASPDEQEAARRDIRALSIPPSLTDTEFRAWISTCLLAASFTNSVIRLNSLDKKTAVKSLAETYKLDGTEARRDMETVQNWLTSLALKTLTRAL